MARRIAALLHGGAERPWHREHRSKKGRKKNAAGKRDLKIMLTERREKWEKRHRRALTD